MPSIRHKFPIAEEIRKTLGHVPVRDLMLGDGKDGDAGMLGTLYQLIGNISGSLELAYHRGYDKGLAAGIKKERKRILLQPIINPKPRKLKHIL